jgi:hypothetical protein
MRVAFYYRFVGNPLFAEHLPGKPVSMRISKAYARKAAPVLDFRLSALKILIALTGSIELQNNPAGCRSDDIWRAM